MKKKTNCLPLKFCNQYLLNKKYKPMLDQLSEEDDPLVYVPYSKVLNTFMSPFMSRDRLMAMALEILNLQVAKAWSATKQIYRFASGLWEILTEKDPERSIPVEILNQIPYKCIFIEPLNAFVYFDYKFGLDKKEYEFHVLQINQKLKIQSMAVFVIHEGKTLKECVEFTESETANAIDPDMTMSFTGQAMDFALLSQALQAVLYICAANADLSLNDKETKPKQAKEETEKQEEPKEIEDKPPVERIRSTRPTTWKVGEVVVRDLKNKKIIESSGSSKSKVTYGYTMRPHIRSAHWHHFWKGTGDNRKLVLKWIPPVYVNKGVGEISTTVNRLK